MQCADCSQQICVYPVCHPSLRMQLPSLSCPSICCQHECPAVLCLIFTSQCKFQWSCKSCYTSLQVAAALGLDLSQNVGIIQALFTHLHHFFFVEQWAQLQGAGARFVLSRTGQGQCLATSQNCIGAGDKLPVAHQYSKQTVTPLHHSPAAVWTAMQLTAGSHQDSPALLVGNVAWQRNMALHQGPPKALGLPLDMAGTLVPAAGAGTGQV